MNSPVLSVVMPVFNAEDYVLLAIESILSQHFQDFELIIVDDASTDKSASIIQSFEDPRIRFIKNDINQGIVYTRNKGLSYMRGQFYAPFDADDVAMPEKFEKQIQFLVQNPEYGMIGSWAHLINEKGHAINKKWKLQADSDSIPWILLFNNYFVHSALVIRREALPLLFYSSGYDHDDYKLCFDISLKYKVWNLQEYLLKYRVHSASHSQNDPERMINAERKIYQYIYKKMGLSFNEEIFGYIQMLKSGNEKFINPDFEKTEQWLYIMWQNLTTMYGPSSIVKGVIYDRWLKLLWKSRRSLLKSPKKLYKSPFLKKYFLR